MKSPVTAMTTSAAVCDAPERRLDESAMKPRTAHRQVCRGFTLIEVMVALTIFAFCAVSMVQVLTQSVDNFSKIERKSFGTWIAENKLNELRLQPNFPAIGEKEVDLEYSNREWLVMTKVIKTELATMRRVEVEVYLREPNVSEPIFVAGLSGFVGES